MTASTFIIADDHPLFRGALRQAVTGIDGEQEIIEAGDFEAARKAAAAHPDAELMLLDLSMPGVSGFSGLTALSEESARKMAKTATLLQTLPFVLSLQVLEELPLPL